MEALFLLPLCLHVTLLSCILVLLAETEKYAHVTFFFNGGLEPPHPKEDRQLVPSPKVPTYDLQPEMSADGVAKAVGHMTREALL